MKKYAVTVAVLVLVLTPSAFAVGNALGPRVTKLEREMNSLRSTVSGLADDMQCLKSGGAVSLAQYDGYTVQFDDGTTGSSSAIDFTDQGDQPDFYAAAIDSSCVKSSQFRLMR
jgi:hypothetical protein